MKTVAAFYALCLGSLWAGEPQFGIIDYGKPSEYLDWPDSLVDFSKQLQNLKLEKR